MQYTKGKWELDTQTGKISADGTLIAQVFGATVHNKSYNADEHKANACLILNAPAMFTLLNELADCQQHSVSDIKFKARDLINNFQEVIND